VRTILSIFLILLLPIPVSAVGETQTLAPADGKFTDPQKAIGYLTNSIRLKPDDFEAYNNRGLTYSYLFQYQLALKDYNEAIRLKPDYAEAYNNRGVVYAYLGRYQNAQADYDKAIRLKPDDNGAYYNYACLFALQLDASQACNWLRLAIERGYKNWKNLQTDKDFNNIRSEKCFVGILNKYAK
jgi:tetratricopeptide (TPR) repeat protein